MAPTLIPACQLAGRVLLAVLFIAAGAEKITQAQATASFMAGIGIPAWPLLAIGVGAFEIVTGAALALGVLTRWAALSLALFTLVASLGFHAFWNAPPDQQFVQHLLFMKNMAIVGGLLFVAGADPVRWSVDAWRLGARLRITQRA